MTDAMASGELYIKLDSQLYVKYFFKLPFKFSLQLYVKWSSKLVVELKTIQSHWNQNGILDNCFIGYYDL